MRNANIRLTDLQLLQELDLPHHPEKFMELFLGTRLWYRQQEILESAWKYKQTFVPTGNSVGKTYLAGRLALAFFYCFATTGLRTRVIIVGAKFDQLKMQTWAEVRSAYASAKFPLGGELRARDLFLSRDKQDSYIAIFGTDKDNPERIQGFHAPNLLVISEESSILDDKVAAALESCASLENNRIVFFGNPIRLSGFFYDRCTDPKIDELKAAGIRNVIQISTLEAPPYVADPQQIEAKRHDWGEESPMWQARVLGRFPQAAEDAVIPWETIEAACDPKRLEQIRPDEEHKVVSMDIARGGDDSVIMALWGDYVYGIRGKRTPNTNEATDWFKEAHKDWGGKAAIDENGLGGGPYDRLRDEHLPIRGFVSQRKARNNERFANLKAETLWSLRERFIEEQIAIPDSRYRDRLKNDLGGYRWKPDMKGRVQIIDPPKSPDYGDALVIAHWRQTASQMNISIHSGGKTLAGDYRNKKF